jgi:hypothetical protein
MEQVSCILSGSENDAKVRIEEVAGPLPLDPVAVEREKYMTPDEKIELAETRRKMRKKDDTVYSVFKLYCSKTLTLDIRLSDYTYGAQMMTFTEFFEAFRRRAALRSGIRRHYYITNYGGGPARAAFDTLSLSLYLIRMYEREEALAEEGDFEIIHLDADVLKEVLETAWSKVNLAKMVAKSNNSEYYSLVQNEKELMEDLTVTELTEEEAILKERLNLPKKTMEKKHTAEDYYKAVVEFSNRDAEEFDAESRKEFDKIMRDYLCKRDATRETNIEAELEELKRIGGLKPTKQCPSRDEYESLVENKQKQISELFEHVLKAERIDVNFDSERERADKAKERYNKAKACLTKNVIVDIVFMVLTGLAVLVPYIIFQLVDANIFGAMVFGLEMVAFTFGFMLLAFFIQSIKYKIIMSRAKEVLRQCYYDCNAKQRYSMSAIRRRYEVDLIKIEQARYELRQLKQLYEANNLKNKNVAKHRDMLDEVSGRLSSMLNNLDVEPVVNPDESVEGEFTLSKSIKARENKVYRIFSIETIERMFPRKGSGDR